MFGMELCSGKSGGHVVVALRGELDLLDAADVLAALGAVAASDPWIIVDLSGLAFIDVSGVAALSGGRRRARDAGGDLLLAAPRQRVVRVITLTRLADGFGVHASVDMAAASGKHPQPAAVPMPRRPGRMRWPRPATPSRTPAPRIAAR